MLKRLSVFLLALLALSLNCAMAEDPNFELGGGPGSKAAIVTEKKFKLDVDVGKAENYKNGAKNFTLAVGGCALDAMIYLNPVTSEITTVFPGRISITELNSINVSPDDLILTGGTTGRAKCNVTFNEQQGGKYYVPVELKGDVPAVFKLSSTEVKMGDPTGSGQSPSTNDSVMSAGAIAGIIIGIVGAVLVSGSVGGFIFYRSRKSKALKKNKEKSGVPKIAESVPPKMPEDVKTAEKKTESSKVPEKKNKSSEPSDTQKESVKGKKGPSKEKKGRSQESLKDKKGPSKEKKGRSQESLKDKKKASPKRKSIDKPAEKKEKSKEAEKKEKTKEAEKKEKSKEAEKKEKSKEAENKEVVNQEVVNQEVVNQEAVNQDAQRMKTAKEATAEEKQHSNPLVSYASDDSENPKNKNKKIKKSKKGKTADVD